MTTTPATTDTPPANTGAAPEGTAPQTTTPAAADPAPTAAPAEPAPTAAPDPAPTAAPAATPQPTQAPTPTQPPTGTKPKKPAATDKTIADPEGEGDPAAPADWPEDWREKLAGDDKKMLATLKRYTSPKTFSEAYFAMKQKLSSGEYLKALPEDATEEEVAEFRKANGIPEKPEGYDTKLPDGLVIGENDKPLVDRFLANMHGVNARPEAVKAALSTYYQLLEQQQADQAAADDEFWEETQNALRTEWGSDYTRNKNLITGLLDTAPAGIKDKLLTARMADGKKVGGDADVLRFLAGLAREVNPVASVVPGAGANAANAISDEIASIQKLMGDHNSEYWKGPKVEGGNETRMQVRYRELIEAQEKIKGRAA